MTIDPISLKAGRDNRRVKERLQFRDARFVRASSALNPSVRTYVPFQAGNTVDPRASETEEDGLPDASAPAGFLVGSNVARERQMDTPDGVRLFRLMEPSEEQRADADLGAWSTAGGAETVTEVFDVPPPVPGQRVWRIDFTGTSGAGRIQSSLLRGAADSGSDAGMNLSVYAKLVSPQHDTLAAKWAANPLDDGVRLQLVPSPTGTGATHEWRASGLGWLRVCVSTDSWGTDASNGQFRIRDLDGTTVPRSLYLSGANAGTSPLLTSWIDGSAGTVRAVDEMFWLGSGEGGIDWRAQLDLGFRFYWRPAATSADFASPSVTRVLWGNASTHELHLAGATLEWVFGGSTRVSRAITFDADDIIGFDVHPDNGVRIFGAATGDTSTHAAAVGLSSGFTGAGPFDFDWSDLADTAQLFCGGRASGAAGEPAAGWFSQPEPIPGT